MRYNVLFCVTVVFLVLFAAGIGLSFAHGTPILLGVLTVGIFVVLAVGILGALFTRER